MLIFSERTHDTAIASSIDALLCTLLHLRETNGHFSSIYLLSKLHEIYSKPSDDFPILIEFLHGLYAPVSSEELLNSISSPAAIREIVSFSSNFATLSQVSQDLNIQIYLYSLSSMSQVERFSLETCSKPLIIRICMLRPLSFVVLIPSPENLSLCHSPSSTYSLCLQEFIQATVNLECLQEIKIEIYMKYKNQILKYNPRLRDILNKPAHSEINVGQAYAFHESGDIYFQLKDPIGNVLDISEMNIEELNELCVNNIYKKIDKRKIEINRILSIPTHKKIPNIDLINS